MAENFLKGSRASLSGGERQQIVIHVDATTLIGRVPGCTSKRFLEAKHIRHWADSGKTALSNLTLLCHAHHQQVHGGQLRILRLDDRAPVFRSGKGEPIEGCGQLTG